MGAETRRAGDQPTVHPFVYSDLCNGIAPVVIAYPRAFVAGRAAVAALALALLGLASLLLSQD